MNTVEWIIMMFLAFALFIFLLLAIILVCKLLGIAKDAKRILATSQNIADKADDIAGNVKDMTSIGGIVKTFADQYSKSKPKKPRKS